MRDRISDSSPTGRRKTISMSQELYDQIQSLLSKTKIKQGRNCQKNWSECGAGPESSLWRLRKEVRKNQRHLLQNLNLSLKKLFSGQADLPLSQMVKPPVPAKPRPKIQRSVTRPPMRAVVKSPLDL